MNSKGTQLKLKFETSNLSFAEISGLIALLETLLPDNECSDNDTPVSRPALGLSTATVRQAQQALESLVGPTASEPAPDQSTTSTRKRRTKAEIAADEAAAAAKASPAPAEAKQVVSEATPDPTSASTPAETPASTPSNGAASTTSKPIDADTLRSLLNSHIQKHSMEEAIAILQSFGCNRVTEALALEPTKLAELASKLDG